MTETPVLQRLRDQFAPRFEVYGVNFRVSGKFQEPACVARVYRAAIVVATFKAVEQQPVLELTSLPFTGSQSRIGAAADMQATTSELATYVKPADLMPRTVSTSTLHGHHQASLDDDRARAVYEWGSKTPSATRDA